MQLITEHCLGGKENKGAHNWRLPFTLKMSWEHRRKSLECDCHPEPAGDSRRERHAAESCSLGRSSSAEMLPGLRADTRLALMELLCFIAGSENLLQGYGAKLWDQDGHA